MRCRLRYPEAWRQRPPGAPADQDVDDRREHCLIRRVLRTTALRPHSGRRDQRLRDLPKPVRNKTTPCTPPQTEVNDASPRRTQSKENGYEPSSSPMPVLRRDELADGGHGTAGSQPPSDSQGRRRVRNGPSQPRAVVRQCATHGRRGGSGSRAKRAPPLAVKPLALPLSPRTRWNALPTGARTPDVPRRWTGRGIVVATGSRTVSHHHGRSLQAHSASRPAGCEGCPLLCP